MSQPQYEAWSEEKRKKEEREKSKQKTKKANAQLDYKKGVIYKIGNEFMYCYGYDNATHSYRFQPMFINDDNELQEDHERHVYEIYKMFACPNCDLLMKTQNVSAKDSIYLAIIYNSIVTQFIILTNTPEEDVNKYFIKKSLKHKDLTLVQLWEKIKEEIFSGEWDINKI